MKNDRDPSQSKPTEDRSVFKRFLHWADGSVIRTFFLFFIALPALAVLILRILAFLLGFEIDFE